jgi:hypothetical protein
MGVNSKLHVELKTTLTALGITGKGWKTGLRREAERLPDLAAGGVAGSPAELWFELLPPTVRMRARMLSLLDAIFTWDWTDDKAEFDGYLTELRELRAEAFADKKQQDKTAG